MPYPSITIVLAEPNSAQPETFNDDANEFASQLNPYAAQLNAAGDYIDAVGTQVDADKTTTGGYVTAAANSASAAASSQALAASSANYIGDWSAQSGAKSAGISVSHIGSFWRLKVNVANIAATTPSLTNTDWEFISGTRWQATRTANFTVAKSAMENVTATSATLDATLPSFVAGDFFVVNNNPMSTQLVRIVKSGVTVAYPNQTVASGDNITVPAGQAFRAFAISSTALVAY